MTCPICKADWPAAAIAPGEITPGPIPTSEEPAAHEVLVFAPLCPVSEGEYQARVTALDARLATALADAQIADVLRKLAEEDRERWRALVDDALRPDETPRSGA